MSLISRIGLSLCSKEILTCLRNYGKRDFDEEMEAEMLTIVGLCKEDPGGKDPDIRRKRGTVNY